MADFAYWLELALEQARGNAAADHAANDELTPTSGWALTPAPDEVLDLSEFIRATPTEESMMQAQTKFLAALNCARAKVVDDGMDVLLRAHDRTIGDDPKFGLPQHAA